MKKFITSLCLAAASIMSMQATNVYILGEVNAEGWKPNVGAEMTTTDGKNFTYTGDFKTSSYFSFTTALAETADDWAYIQPYRIGASWNNYKLDETNFNQVIACNEMGIDTDNAFLMVNGGNYTLTFNVEDFTLIVKPNGEIKPEEIVPDGLYIMGEINGQEWKTNQGTKMTTTDDVVYTAEIAIADSAANFSFTRALSEVETNWAGIEPYRFGAIYNNYSVTEELGQAITLGDEGTDYSFELAQGYYKVTVDMTARTMTVVATEEPAQKYYVIGTAFGNWDPKNPVELVKEEGEADNYSTEFEFVGDNYFVFTGAKGSWDAINAFRFGPLEANEEVEVATDVTTQLSTNGDASYKMVCNGKYKVTFNPTALSFKVEVVTDPQLKGDINADGVVDIADVNACIDMILGLQDATKVGDVNGDGNVDVADMNAIIDIVLGL